MISFRPHKILFKQASAGSTDENGVWQEGSNSFIDDNIHCRVENNGRARTIILPDGTSFAYSYLVLLDADVREFVYGELIQVQDKVGNIIIKEMVVQGFFRNQLNSKLYL